MIHQQFSRTTSITKLVAISTVSQIGAQIINAVAGIVIIRTLTSSLGVKDYGLYATILAFVSTFSLLTDLGLNGITGRDIAKNPKDASSIISHNMGFRLFLSGAILPVILAISYMLYRNQGSTIHLGILLLSTYLFFDAIRSVSLAYFTAKIRNDIAALVGVIQQLSFLIFVIIVSFEHFGLFGFLIAYVSSNIIGAGIALFFARKEVSVTPKVNIKLWRQIMSRSISLGIIIVINMMYLKADSIMLSVLRSTDDVAIYGIAYSLILMIMAVPSFLMTALIPSMTTSNNKDLASIVTRAFHFMSIIACLIVIGGVATKDNIVLVIADKHFADAAIPFAILTIASAFSSLNYVFGFASVSVNKHHKMVFVSLFCLIFNIIINIYFIPKYGYRGAAISTAITELLALICVYTIFTRETKIKVNIRSAIRPIFAAVPALLTCLYLNHIWKTSYPIFNTFISGSFTVISFLVILYFVKGLPVDATNFINKFCRKFSSE